MVLSYHDYISPQLTHHLLSNAKNHESIPEFCHIGELGGLETHESLEFLVELYSYLQNDLRTILEQRVTDRKFIDQRVKALGDEGHKFIGLKDTNGRVILGPLQDNYCKSGGPPVAPIPNFLQGPHVTLFGPPDSAKMAINAMNCYHRKLEGEPEIVEELLAKCPYSPKWGADDEDSKTPLHSDLIDAGVNLTACFDKTISIPGNDKYQLAKSHLATPIKRFPGLALPCSFMFYKEKPIPLHLYDFALHLYKNYKNPEALVFYVPKLENEEEAAYIHKMIHKAEELIQKIDSSYQLGSIRLMVVLENPRAILRAHEIIDKLYPYFVGASLGWHDYLGSMARIFKENSNYRIPVKADPDIVIKYIKASHRLLAEVVGSRGGIKVGGMYGILPIGSDLQSDSFQLTLLGFVKDVITQMKRDLTGYWVAHPDFVRLGLAFVEAWKQYQNGRVQALKDLISGILIGDYREEALDFCFSEDIEGLDESDPNYVRSLIVADIKESDFIANNDPEEVRYNVFQSLQYLTDWLCGNGCVALPAIVKGVAVRVMDDLATAERSRWEVWHEIYHKRFSTSDFIRIAHEEMHFIRKDLSNNKKIVQVKWSENTAKWYPVAFRIMLKLMTDEKPPEFATELLMPFTVESLREAQNPLTALNKIDSNKLSLRPEVEELNTYFEACGCQRFANEMSKKPVFDLNEVRSSIMNFSVPEINEAAFFHGDIGEKKQSLDENAKSEQANVLDSSESIRNELLRLGEKYKTKFGFKFLISAKGKSPDEIKAKITQRLEQSLEQEIDEAKNALYEISAKRLLEKKPDDFKSVFYQILEKQKINVASLSLINRGEIQNLTYNCQASDSFQLASLSKSFAAAFCIHYFAENDIPLCSSVNEVFAKTKSEFRLSDNSVKIFHLLNHTALNKHYVAGYPTNNNVPKASELLSDIEVICEPGLHFNYSGGGFLVLEHLIESLSGESSEKLMQNYFDSIGFEELCFKVNHRKDLDGEKLRFPLFAAGATGTPRAVASFLLKLEESFHNLEPSNSIDHDTAVKMLHSQDLGSVDFMGAGIGLGVFVAEAGDNKIAVHQGANEGYRALYFHCFSGPDRGKGFVICVRGDNEAVLAVSEIAQNLIQLFNFSGVDYKKFNSEFDYSSLKQESIVNLGYKKLVFNSFIPCLPEPISTRTETDPLAQYNLAVGAKILSCSDQKFARAENIFSDQRPVFDPELFGQQGKIMDSWESSRHNPTESHCLEFSLKEESEIKYVYASTHYHNGNHVEAIALYAFHGDWTLVLPPTKLRGHCEKLVKLESPVTSQRFKLLTFPDGGLTRLGLFNKVPFAEEFDRDCADEIPQSLKPSCLPFTEGNFAIESVSNEHYGPARQLLSPYAPLHMFDGFESARSRESNHSEEVIINIKKPQKISKIVLDFSFFRNNNPRYMQIEALDKNDQWHRVCPKFFTKAFAGNSKAMNIQSDEIFKKLKLILYPDGGINRIRIY